MSRNALRRGLLWWAKLSWVPNGSGTRVSGLPRGASSMPLLGTLSGTFLSPSMSSEKQMRRGRSRAGIGSGAPGASEGKLGLGLHHQVKHLGTQHLVFTEVTCAQAVLDDRDTAPHEIARVLTAARELSRPVYIEFPRDMVEADVEPVPAFAET